MHRPELRWGANGTAISQGQQGLVAAHQGLGQAKPQPGEPTGGLRGWSATLRAADARHLAIANGVAPASAAWMRRLWRRSSSWGSMLGCLGRHRLNEDRSSGTPPTRTPQLWGV